MKYRILQIGKFYPPYHFGGIETLSKFLHDGLRERSINSDFIGFLPLSYNQDIKVDEHIYLCKTDVNLWSVQISFNFVKKWRSVKEQYDIVFISMPHPFAHFILNIFFCKKAKIILWWHSDIIKQKFLLQIYKPFLVSFLKKIDAVVAPTNIHIDKSNFSKYLVPKKYIIPFPYEYKKHQCSYTLREGNYVIFSCGRLVYYKGFHNLIDAAEYLPNNCIIRIAGTGKMYDKLDRQITSKGLSKKVFLLGCITNEQLEQELRDCFLFCLSSIERSEMYAVVQIEAFCHGKPVISTNIPRSGVSEVNRNGVTGYTVEINNPKAISDKINILLHDPVQYEIFCRNALLRAEELTDKNIIDKYIELFANIMPPPPQVVVHQLRKYQNNNHKTPFRRSAHRLVS
jgi:glycosyltransferase involved in cell wall biosynthesis